MKRMTTRPANSRILKDQKIKFMLDQILFLRRLLKVITFYTIVAFTATSCDDEKEAAQPQPTITSLSITEGEVGTSVTVTGTNFGTAAADVSVFFNTTEADPTTVTNTTLTVTVPAGATSGTVKVKVKSLEASGPSFSVLAPITVSATTFTKTMQENPIGIEGPFSLGNISATTNRGTLTYSLSSQTPEGAMTINTSTGQLLVANAAAFDFEVNPSITGVVTVANGEETATANITVTITNVEEVTLSNLAFSKAENPDIENLDIGSVTCCWIGASPSFVITSQSPEGSVVINAGNGQFTVANVDAFDFETNPTITGTYSVTSQSETKTANFTISLTDVNEVPPPTVSVSVIAIVGSEATSACTDGSGNSIRLVTPYLGSFLQADGGPLELFIADKYCGARKITFPVLGSITASTLQSNNDPETYEYVDVLNKGTYNLITYRGVGFGQGNVLKVPTNGSAVSNFSSNTLNAPSGLATDDAGNIYVTELRSIKKFSSTGGSELSVYGDGQIGSVDGAAATAQFRLTSDVHVNAHGDLIVADLYAIRKIATATGTVSTLVGNGNDQNDVNGTLTTSRFSTITSIGLLPNGNIIVADSGSRKIKLVDMQSGTVATLLTFATAQPQGIIAINNDTFYFTRTNSSAIYKATLSSGCAQCR